jgi:hypothetical protein
MVRDFGRAEVSVFKWRSGSPLEPGASAPSGENTAKIPTVGIRNQPLRIVVVVGLWAMWVLWTVTRFSSTAIVSLPFTSTTCPSFKACGTRPAVAAMRQFSCWWHFLFTVIGAVLLVAASTMILRTPRSVDEI